MKSIKNISRSILVGALAVLATSCEKDFLDINQDPYSPNTAAYSLVLPASQGAMATGLGHSVLGMGQPSSAFVHQLVNFRVNNYDLNGSTFNNPWLTLYTNALSNFQAIIDRGTVSGDWRYVGIAKIQKAYVFSQMVDLWGDIPYSEALKGAGVTAPKFDKDAEIYNDLFKLLDEGIADLAKTSPVVSGDLIYGGNVDKWRKFAKTVKLKMYNQVRLTKDVSAEVNQLIKEGDLLAAGEDFEFKYNASTNPDNRHPGFTNEYAQSSRENHISPWFYNVMRGKENIGGQPNPFLGIDDPRVPYYFFNQVTTTASQSVADYQDGKFISRFFGSRGPQASSNDNSVRTVQGLYPVGGKYDDDKGGAVTGASGAKGAIAQRLLTYFQRKFIEAEVQLTINNNPVAAREALKVATEAAFAKVNEVAPAGNAPAIPVLVRDAYVNAILAKYDLANEQGKLEIIMTEKWVSSFGTGIDSYTDYRRTGYPIIFDPKNPANPAQYDRTGEFPLSVPYRQIDLTSNKNAPAQRNPATDKIFWDK